MEEDEVNSELTNCVFSGTLSICSPDRQDSVLELSQQRILKIKESSVKRSDFYPTNWWYALAHEFLLAVLESLWENSGLNEMLKKCFFWIRKKCSQARNSP